MKIEMKREQTEPCSSLPSGGDLSKEPLIQLNRIQVGYDGKQVLRDIDLTVYTHDFLGVIGPNGGGKTTLIKTILGLKKPSGKADPSPPSAWAICPNTTK